MKNLSKTVLLAGALSCALAAPAMADWARIGGVDHPLQVGLAGAEAGQAGQAGVLGVHAGCTGFAGAGA